jgi:hypothetical protein
MTLRSVFIIFSVLLSLIEKNEMGVACSSDGKGRGVYRVWWGNLRERDHRGDPDVDGRIILKWIFKK